jgi:hypothetical protein
MSAADGPRPPVAAGTPRTLADPLAEALRIVSLADARGLLVRLMGGLAFHAQAPTWTAPVGRDGRDIDLATRGTDRKALAELLIGEGYTPDRQYNALYGHKQLYFVDEALARPLDVLVDRMEMCHTFDFRDRLGVAHPTLPLAELLLSKLQVVRLTRKDVLDSLILLGQHPLAETDGDRNVGGASAAINVRQIVAVSAGDWGWWRTISGNLDALRTFVEGELATGDLEIGAPLRHDLLAQLASLRKAIDAEPKSARWKLRARVGDRVPWYREPEEVGHGR